MIRRRWSLRLIDDYRLGKAIIGDSAARNGVILAANKSYGVR
jgi:hypothetical protein